MQSINMASQLYKRPCNWTVHSDSLQKHFVQSSAFTIFSLLYNKKKIQDDVTGEFALSKRGCRGDALLYAFCVLCVCCQLYTHMMISGLTSELTLAEAVVILLLIKGVELMASDFRRIQPPREMMSPSSLL
jgi:hypothetical protein